MTEPSALLGSLLDEKYRVLEGIEIYRGPAETPIRYQITNSACGVALLWTRESP